MLLTNEVYMKWGISMKEKQAKNTKLVDPILSENMAKPSVKVVKSELKKKPKKKIEKKKSKKSKDKEKARIKKANVKGGKNSGKTRRAKAKALEDASLREVMEDVIKSPSMKRQICKDFLKGKFNAKSMQVLLQMLDGSEEKTSFEDFINEQN